MDRVATHFKSGDFKGRQKEIFDIYTKLHKANRHKMEPIPVCMIPKGLG